MDIYRYLHNDYREISEVLEQLLAMRSDEHRQELFRTLRHTLLVHLAAAEKTFYAALADYPGTAELIHQAQARDNAMKEYIGKLLVLPMDSPPWLHEFGELRHTVSQHIKAVESRLFTQAKKHLSHAQAIQLSKDMDATKRAQQAQ